MNIVKSYKEPNTNAIWFNINDNNFYYFNNGKWRLFNNLESTQKEIQEITYSELKNLRDNSQLIPGATYRITDYTCTTIQEGTQSAGHDFDILVTADDVNILNENARAIQHSGDTYFANSDLSSWELKYCLDNDTTRFEWAKGEKWTTTFPEIGAVNLTPVSTNDTTYEGHPYKFTFFIGDLAYTLYVAHLELQDGEETIPNVITLDGMEPMVNQMSITAIINVNQTEGHGVVYYMKDEFNNECPYDFKNIQYKLYGIDEGATSATTVILTNAKSEEQSLSIYNNVKGLTDVISYKYNVNQYTLGTWVNNKGFETSSNFTEDNYDFNKVYIGFGDINNHYFGVDVLWPVTGTIKYIYTFSSDDATKDLSMNGYANNVYNNSMLSYVVNNTQVLNTNVFFGNNNYGNVMSNNGYSNTFGNECDCNTFGNNYYCNTFGNNCSSNKFGNKCYYNNFGAACDNNTFINNCYSNTFGNYFRSNTFGNDCYWNTFGNDCDCNTFVNYCSSNTFGNFCGGNTFGNNCSNTFGNYCANNTFGNNCNYNTFGNGCYYNTFGNDCYYNTFGNDYIRHCTFFDGVCELNVSITTANSNNYLQNMQVLNGTQGTESNKLQITGDTYVTAGRDYTTTIGMNSSGTLTSKVPMDA